MSGSLRRQDINTHGIDYIEYVSSFIKCGKISLTCRMWVWGNDMNCRYIGIYVYLFVLFKDVKY